MNMRIWSGRSLFGSASHSICANIPSLMPEDLEVSISYRLPEDIMNGLVAGDGFEPPTFGL